MYGIQNGSVNLQLIDAGTLAKESVNAITPNTVTGLGTAIYANPCKAFGTTRVTWDPNILSANVASVINDRINEWTSLHGERYDDILININNSGGATHDIQITIIRNY
jgi:hypothetical protein